MYTPLQFNGSLLLNIPEIDRQHRQIADIINQLIRALQPPHHNTSPYTPHDTYHNDSANTCDHGLTPQDIRHHLDDLIKATEEHFLYEERLMKKIRYPGHTEHKREHLLLMAELKSFIRDILADNAQLDLKSIDSLKRWFVLHIHCSDMAFARSFLAASKR